MIIQSFILCIVAIMLLFYKKFNKRDYKTISDKQQKVLYISNIINFRNSLFDYCNSLDLLDVKYEIENNDLIYMDRLLQIKNKIDNYYKQINVEYLDSETSDNSVADDEATDNEATDNEATDNETVDNEINTKITENNIEKDINRLLVL